MAIIDPFVRHMIVCEDVTVDPNDARRVTFEGLLSTIDAPDPAAFPVIVPKLSVYLRIAGGRGTGRVRLVVLEESTGQAVFTGASHSIQHPANPLHAASMIMRIRRCVFPRPGLY
jgi:Family of unknown function (DUF6941)